MDVFDPVLGNGCCTPGAKGITWHPIKTATNGQLALGMTRWIIENKAYNADYLGFTNYKAAELKAYLEQAGFHEVQIYKKKNWLCVTARK